MELVISRAHPNPAEKDRSRYSPPTNTKLNEEWLQFYNSSHAGRSLSGITLWHKTFSQACSATGYDKLMSFTGTLASGSSVRVHSGAGETWVEGTVTHLYAGRSNFVWNNSCGDTAYLQDGDATHDYAYYDPNPPDDVILVRQAGSNKLA